MELDRKHYIAVLGVVCIYVSIYLCTFTGKKLE